MGAVDSNKKFMILTINVLDNYGNRLQNYALQEVLREFGSVRTALRIYKATTKFSYIKQLFKKKILEGVKQTFEHIKAGGLKSGAAYATRIQKGREFNRRLINQKGSEVVSAYTSDKLGKADQDVVYVLGSDQIWNFQLLGVSDERDILASFAAFAPATNVISYAASFGVSHLPSSQTEVVSRGLQHVSQISVREFDGINIVQECIGSEPELVLDPTLMVPSSTWSGLLADMGVQKPSTDKYLLTHLLGEVSPERMQIIQDYAQAHSLKIRGFRGMNDFSAEASGPLEFINLIANAEMVFTDSFHATCFSIIFHKQFKTFAVSYSGDTSNTNSRTESLLAQLQIKDLMSSDAISTINYHEVERILQQRRERSLNWLKKAIAESI